MHEKQKGFVDRSSLKTDTPEMMTCPQYGLNDAGAPCPRQYSMKMDNYW